MGDFGEAGQESKRAIKSARLHEQVANYRLLPPDSPFHQSWSRGREASFLPDNISSAGERDRLHDLDRRENGWFAATKRIVSGWARNAPFLPLHSRDARTVMIQNANRIKSNDRKLPHHEGFLAGKGGPAK
jgi:hypothetical protein